jgi:hypothetical protein
MSLTLRPARVGDSSSNSDGLSVDFVVGNDYRRLPDHAAPRDRSRRFKKVHDWTLYVDVVKGDPNLIERVVFDLGSTFNPQTYICSCPISLQKPNGRFVWRFSTRQQVYGATDALIAIRGVGGTKMEISHSIQLRDTSQQKSVVHTFTEPRGKHPLRMLKIPDSQRFGVELELTSPPGISPSDVADVMPRSAGDVYVVDSYREGRQAYQEGWKIVPDSSIVCNRNMPSCHKFELVSRVLQGGKGLAEVSHVISALNNSVSPKLQVNKSMGYHVHIDVSGLSLPHLIKICQNFVKYESVMDTFMPLSRRTGSTECERYFGSNKLSVQPDGASNKQRHVALENCHNIQTLAHMMNRNGRYYKLNLQNLVTQRQPTLEFRQHSATLNYEKISAWIRFW